MQNTYQEQVDNATVCTDNQKIIERVVDILLRWEMPAFVVAAASIVPQLNSTSSAPGKEGPAEHDAAQRLAATFVHWCARTRHYDENSPSPTDTQLIDDKRFLFRHAYLDLPDLNFILLIVAFHVAIVDARTSLSKRLARVTHHVYIPLAEMLGLREIRNGWVEKSTRVLEPAEYRTMEEALAVPTERRDPVDTARLLRAFASRKVGREAALSAEEEHFVEQYEPFLEKALAFRHLEQGFQAAVVEADFSITPDLRLVHEGPGLTLRRLRDGVSREEMERRLHIQVLCQTPSDCYRALGVLHRLGAPVSSRYAVRFDDYIASPQLNGYAALHTTIVYEYFLPKAGKLAGSGQFLVQFRIVTASMQALNTTGFVAYRRHRLDCPVAWWRQYDTEEVRRMVAAQDLDSEADSVYVFTPRGQLIQLTHRSTVLDFAYTIHSKLGHNARGATVNGREAPLDYILKNGDVVLIHEDPHSSGPDLSWLSFVGNPRTRSKIRRELVNRSLKKATGRNIIENNLIKLQQHYQTAKGYHFTITNSQLDTYLRTYARERGFLELQSFYKAVETDEESVSKVVQKFVDTIFATLIVGADGRPLTFRPHQLSFCATCRVVPGDRIVAYQRRRAGGAGKLVIHKRDNTACGGALTTGVEVDVVWAREAQQKTQLFTLYVSAQDRKQLLRDILDAVYDNAQIDLHEVRAHTHNDGSADIFLLLSASHLLDLLPMQGAIEAVSSVRRVEIGQTTQHRARIPDHLAVFDANPFSERVVSDRLDFFDRQEPIAEIVNWLGSRDSGNWLVLHGPRRVGKTSLTHHLAHEILSRRHLAWPILFDLQGFAHKTVEGLAAFLIHGICEAVQMPVPDRPPAAQPMQWLEQVLTAAREYIGGAQLLLMVDEFDVLLEDTQAHRDLFSSLRYIITRQPTCRWLFVIQDMYYHDSEKWGSAASIFGEHSASVQLDHLEEHWARRLIVEPAQRAGITFAGEIPARISRLTNGNPYLIKALCFTLLDRLRRENRRTATDRDLTDAVNLVAFDSNRYFAHFIESLSPLRKMILSGLASSCEPEESATLQSVLNCIKAVAPTLYETAFYNTVRSFEHQGVLTCHDERFEIPIRLFHLWARDKYDLETTAAEWRNAATR